MILAVCLGMLLGSALTIFSLQNASSISISVLTWHVSAPIAEVVVAAAGVSIIAALLALLPAMLKGEKRIKALQIEKRLVENELSKYRIIIPVAPPVQTVSSIRVEPREMVQSR